MNNHFKRFLLGSWLVLVVATFSWAAEVMPPVPTSYFNDYARVVSTATAGKLNKALEDFERETSNQILVAVYPKMQSDSSIEDYTVRVAQSWRVGQKARNNGAVLFVFIQDRKMFIQVGYGLEGALPDALAKRIIENELKPRFRAGNYEGGLSAGVAAMMAATKGEYRGTGRTGRGQPSNLSPAAAMMLVLVFGFVAVSFALAVRRGVAGARRGGYYGGWTIGRGGYSSGSWGGGGGGGGGFSSGGGFSGGGGSFGGGGAGGSW